MTKGQALANHNYPGGVSKAMDEYAKEQAIAFGDWIKENRWCYQEHLHEPSNWRYFNERTEEDKYASTQELYNQFIEQQTNQP